MQVEKLRKKWDDLMTKYKTEIDAVAKSYRETYIEKQDNIKEKSKKGVTASSTKSANVIPRRDGPDSEFIKVS